MTLALPGLRRSRPAPHTKVIHVTTTDMSLEWLLGPQLRAMRDAGYEVVGASAPGPYVEALEQAGIRHIPLRHATRAMAPTRDVRALGELVQIFRRERPAIVHTHNPKPGWYGRVAAGIARTPIVVNTVHGLYATPDDPAARRAVVYALERAASLFSDAELVQNPEDVTVLRRLGLRERKVTLLGNGVDLKRFAPSRPDPRAVAALREELGADESTVLVGAVGRLVWEKGLREVFAAAAALRRTIPQVRIAVIGPLDPDKGDGLAADDLERISDETGVVFPGERSDMEVVYQALDVYVLASYREGFPRSAMEAAAMGTPIVATDIRGCRQVVDHGETGLLVPVGDATALAEAIARLADDDGLRASLAAGAARKAIDCFDQQRVIDITLSTYEALLGADRVP